jgi:hypothetical protein
MGIFKPVYEQGIVVAGQISQPTKFERVYCGYSPKHTNGNDATRAIAVHQDQFAITSPAFNKVFVYRMNESF